MGFAAELLRRFLHAVPPLERLAFAFLAFSADPERDAPLTGRRMEVYERLRRRVRGK